MMTVEGRKTITITSGRAGVGKSSIVSNMAYILGNMNKATFILDANLALGNNKKISGIASKSSVKDFF